MILEVRHIFKQQTEKSQSRGFSVFMLSLLLLSGCGLTEDWQMNRYEIDGEAQGTTYHIVYYTDSVVVRKEEVDSVLSIIDDYLSIWVEHSLISELNADTGRKIPFSDPYGYFTDNYLLSKKVYEETNGTFDPTVGPLVNAWGFGAEGKRDLDSAEVSRLMELVGFDKTAIIETGSGWEYHKENPEIRLDFNAIAQGYSVDVLSAYFSSRGLNDHMIEVGGELICKGKKEGGKPWKIGIDKPTEDNVGHTLEAVIVLHDKALATSGNYRKFFEKEGVKYVHTINPQTGYPVLSRLLSATVVADNCALADAYATAMMVMGLEQSIDFLKNHPELEGYLIYSDEEGNLKTIVSEGIQQALTEIR